MEGAGTGAAGGQAGGSAAPGGAGAAAQATTGTAGTAGTAAAAGAGGSGGGTGTGAAQASTGASAGAADWQSSFDEGTRGYISNKGWKEPAHMLESYRNLEKMVGASPEQVIRLPKADDPQAQDAFNRIYDQLGRPKTAADYKLDALIPKENGSPDFAKAAGDQFHKLGLSSQQATELVKWWNETQSSQLKGMQDARAVDTTKAKENLQREWGAAHEQNMNLARTAAKEFGVTPEVIDAIENVAGYDGVMKLFHSVGKALGRESGNFHSGATPPGNGMLTPGEARAKLTELQRDQGWLSRYLAGDQKARAEKDRLDRFAVGESA